MTVIVVTPTEEHFDPATTPPITLVSLIADHIEALACVPSCLSLAVHTGYDLPFDVDCVTVFRPGNARGLRPEGKHANQVTLRTIEFAILCGLKWWGGGVNIHEKDDGSRWLRSTHTSRAPELGGSVLVSRIFEDAPPRQTVKGATHVAHPEPS